jgi:hypothetical protein
VDLPPFTPKPTSAMIAEVFKIEDRRVTQIEALLEFPSPQRSSPRRARRRARGAALKGRAT